MWIRGLVSVRPNRTWTSRLISWFEHSISLRLTLNILVIQAQILTQKEMCAVYKWHLWVYMVPWNIERALPSANIHHTHNIICITENRSIELLFIIFRFVWIVEAFEHKFPASVETTFESVNDNFKNKLFCCDTFSVNKNSIHLFLQSFRLTKLKKKNRKTKFWWNIVKSDKVQGILIGLNILQIAYGMFNHCFICNYQKKKILTIKIHWTFSVCFYEFPVEFCHKLFIFTYVLNSIEFDSETSCFIIQFPFIFVNYYFELGFFFFSLIYVLALDTVRDLLITTEIND